MKAPASWLYVLSAALIAPLALAVTAFFTGLWHRRSQDLPALLDEDQLGI